MRVQAIPLIYDAVSDQATLYKHLTVQVTCQAPVPVGIVEFGTDQPVYAIGDAVNVTAVIVNVGDTPVELSGDLHIEDDDGLTVVGEVGDIPEAEAQVQALQPDLAVVDVMLSGVNGLEGTPRLKAVLPTLRVILVSGYSDCADLFRAAAEEAGAEAFIPRRRSGLECGVRAWKG